MTESGRKKKKVLYLITKSNWGGAQRYVYDLATNLDQSQFEPVVALGGNGTLKDMLEHAHIRVIHIKSLERDISLTKEITFAKELWNILHAETPDVFHVNSSKAGGVGTLLGRLARVPRVLFTAHGWAFNEDRSFWQRYIIKFLHWLTVLFSHRTIAVSHAIVQQMNWPLAQKKMRVVHLGRTIGAMYSKGDARLKIVEYCQSLEHYMQDTWLLSIAELHPIKRHTVLIEAMKEVVKTFPRARCVCVGQDSGEKNRLEKLIQNTKLTENVFLIGPITEAARFLQAGDIFVHPSKSEAYGYVLHEAGLAGLPVIACNVGGIPDVVTSNTSGLLVSSDNSSEFARAILAYLKEPDLRTEHARNLQVTMRERTTQKMVEKTCAHYLLRL